MCDLIWRPVSADHVRAEHHEIRIGSQREQFLLNEPRSIRPLM